MNAEELTAMRKSVNFSSREMCAEWLGCSASHYIKCERGERRVPKWMIAALKRRQQVLLRLRNHTPATHKADAS